MILYFAGSDPHWMSQHCNGVFPVLIAYANNKKTMQRTRKRLRRMIKDRNRKGKSNDYGKG